MSGLVVFDQKGALGPATTLLLNINHFSSSGLEKLTLYVEEQFEKMAGIKPNGRIELCELVIKRNLSGKPLSISETINTLFFQEMQWKGSLPEYHYILEEQIVPNCKKYIREMFPDAIIKDEEGRVMCDWLAKFMETYLSEKDIRSMYQKGQVNENVFLEKRKKVGTHIYKLTQTKDFSEEDLDCLLAACRNALTNLQDAHHPTEAMKLTGKYLKLFSLGDNSLSRDVLEKLDGIFRKKFFNS